MHLPASAPTKRKSKSSASPAPLKSPWRGSSPPRPAPTTPPLPSPAPPGQRRSAHSPGRRRPRECALQLLFQWEGDRPDPASLLPAFWQGRKVDHETLRFAEELFLGTPGAAEETDSLLAAHSEHWKLERMAA